MQITILTPTYNRKDLLCNLYESLKSQICKDFEWLVVDDGSADGTEQLVEDLIKQSEITIRYLRKENGGKHTALNLGISNIESPLTFIVDSDDTLTPDAVGTILSVHEKYGKNDRLCGYAFLRQYPDGKINGKLFAKDELIDNYINVRINSDDTLADKAEVFFTECLKRFPFPVYNGEKFLGEDIVWIRMARLYDMVHINKAVYISNYLEDGLTRGRRIHNIASPLGCMNRAAEFIGKDIKFKYRIKGCLQYIVYGKFAGYGFGELIRSSKDKFLTVLLFVPGSILYYKFKRDNAKK